MKKLNYLLAGLAFFAIFSFSSCGSDDESANETDSTITELEEKMDKIESEEPDSLTTEGTETGINTTAKYVCPNGCKESGSDKPGDCKNTECGMELMENLNYKEQ